MTTTHPALSRNTPGDPLGHAYDRAVNNARSINGTFDDVDRKLLNIGWEAGLDFVRELQPESSDPLGAAYSRAAEAARELAPKWTDRNRSMFSAGWDPAIRYVKSQVLDQTLPADEPVVSPEGAPAP